MHTEKAIWQVHWTASVANLHVYGFVCAVITGSSDVSVRLHNSFMLDTALIVWFFSQIDRPQPSAHVCVVLFVVVAGHVDVLSLLSTGQAEQSVLCDIYKFQRLQQLAAACCDQTKPVCLHPLWTRQFVIAELDHHVHLAILRTAQHPAQFPQPTGGLPDHVHRPRNGPLCRQLSFGNVSHLANHTDAVHSVFAAHWLDCSVLRSNRPFSVASHRSGGHGERGPSTVHSAPQEEACQNVDHGGARVCTVLAAPAHLRYTHGLQNNSTQLS